MVEEATVEHPFQFISGLGTTLERFETEITALKKGDKFEFVIPTAEAYGEYMPEGVRTVSKDMFTIDGVFDEERYFTPGGEDVCTFDVGDTRFCVNICEDIWFPEAPYRTMKAITSTLP